MKPGGIMSKNNMKRKRILVALAILTCLTFVSAGPGAVAATSPGDVDNKGTVELADAITALKALVGLPSDAVKAADANGDDQIGVAEVIYILRKVILDTPATSINEPFDTTGTPLGWTVESTGDTEWRFDQGAGNNRSGGDGNFAIADSQSAGAVDMDTELRTRLTDLSQAPAVQLTFKTYYEPYGDSKADVDVSGDGGTTWNTVWSQAITAINATVILDISSDAGGKSEVMVRFHYHDANEDMFWQIDDVEISGISSPTSVPDHLDATIDGTQVSLKWNYSGSNATSFKVERSTNSDSDFSNIASLKKDTTTLTDTDTLACDTTYYYRVLASNTAGDSEPSNVVQAEIAACQGLTSLSENFDAEAKPADWEVKKSSGNYEWVFDDPNNRIGELGLDAESKFALADGMRGEAINTELITPLLNLTSFSAVNLKFSTFLYFQAGGTAKADVSTDSGATWTTVWEKTDNLNHVPFDEQTVDISDKVGGRSDVKIRFHADDLSAVWIVDDVQLETMGNPDAPTDLEVAQGSGGVVNLSWNGEETSDFEIERSAETNANWGQIDSVSGGVTTYVDSNVKGNTTYYYRVRASNAAGTSDTTNVANITTSDRSVVTYDITVSYYDTAENTEAKKATLENCFNYFADAVYESSNGANKIGQITFYTGGNWSDKADVVWVESCHPNAYISGYARAEGPYKRIEMCDVFTNAGINFLDGDETSQIQAGYIIGHEWGHYFYSLYDEYVGSTDASSISSPSSDDIAVENSIMNSQYKAVNGDFEWLNFSTPLNNNTETNAQYRVYGASAWETLVRTVSEDPRDGSRSNAAVRIYHAELQDVAPGSGEAPSTQLQWPAGAGQDEARSELNFVWADMDTGKRQDVAAGGVVRVVLIDCSKGMTPERLRNAKAAVAQLVKQTPVGDAVGIISFDRSVTTVYSLKTIGAQTDKPDIITAINEITIGTEGANLGEALQTALTALETNAPKHSNRVVYLITPGRDITGTLRPLSVIPAYEEAFVELYTFGYGAGDRATELMKAVAEQTGGTYRFIGEADELKKAMDKAQKETSPLVLVNIKTGWKVLESNETYHIPIYIDETLGEFGLYLYYLTDQEFAGFTLTDPSGDSYPIPPKDFSIPDPDEWGWTQETTCFHLVDTPAAGEWRITVETLDKPVPIFYWIDAAMEKNQLTYTATVESVLGDEIAYPDPILLSASVGKDFLITGAVVEGIIELPDGNTQSFIMSDDGVRPDAMANDGIYAYIFTPHTDGDYHVTVRFGSSDGTAKFSNYGVNFAPDQNGNVPAPSVWDVGENFERFAELQVHVTGTLPDDHSDWHHENPTVLPPNNRPVPGRIDLADDVDTFVITVPDDYEGELILRIDNLGMGMDPFLYIFAKDWSWKRDAMFEVEPEPDDSLRVPLYVMPGETFYVEVRHLDDTAETGLYNISAGPRLVNETRGEI